MSYSKLSKERKKNIGRNANNYAKEMYKQFTIRLDPGLADKFDSVCQKEGVSRPELIKRLLDIYNGLT